MNASKQLLMTDNRYISLISTLENAIKTCDADLLEKYPVDEYITYLEQYPTYAGYKYCSDEVERFCNIIESNGDKEVMETYHKLLLIRLVHKNRNKFKQLMLPEEIKSDYRKDFNRIVSQVENRQSPKGYFLYKNDRFYKDLAICSLRLFPVGARKYELTIFPIKRFMRKGWRQFAKLLIYLAFETRGLAPFLTGHYDTDDPGFMKEFNLEDFIHAYRTIAEVMKLNPGIKGYYGINWLNDPQIERISPHLAYIRYMNIACGCRYFCLGANASTIKNATMKSPSRRKLYHDGKYFPENYAFAFSRKRLIDWADQRSWHW